MHYSLHPRTPAQLPPQHSTLRVQTRLRAGPSADHVERAVLAGVLLPASRADPRDPLGELGALAESVGVLVVDAIVQKRMSLSPGTAFGRGKLAELIELVQASQANVVIFDNDLAPRQIRELERRVECKIIDRSELILDIFASRAKTREAQLQVELAQLEYTAPRLRGLWTHLERIAGAAGATGAGVVGGVGTRGPGERQIEIDRRIVRKRIRHLKREIAEIDKRKRREVEARGDQFTVSLVGYTNSGKTTLLNRLAETNQHVADKLFATLDTKTVRWELKDGQSALLSDTVGFVRDIPHGLVASFRATLEEAIHADLLLHVVDSSSPAAWQQMESVEEVLADLGCAAIPQILVLNKIDVADDASMAEVLALRRSGGCNRSVSSASNALGTRRNAGSAAADTGMAPAVLQVSARTGEGCEHLVREVTRLVTSGAVEVTVYIPHSESKLIAQTDRLADVLDRRYVQDGVQLDLRMNRTKLRQLLGRSKSMTIINGTVGEPDPSETDAAR